MYLFTFFPVRICSRSFAKCLSFSSVNRPRESKQYLKSWRGRNFWTQASHPIHHVIQEQLSAAKLETLQKNLDMGDLHHNLRNFWTVLFWRGLSVSPDPLTMVHWLLNMQFSFLFIFDTFYFDRNYVMWGTINVIRLINSKQCCRDTSICNLVESICFLAGKLVMTRLHE